MPGEGEIAIFTREIRKSYSGREVLHGISLEVKFGEIYSLLGPNGAGKTTFLGIISGILVQDSGEVKVCGKDPKDREARKKMGYSPQDPGLFYSLNAVENMIAYGKMYGMKKEEILERGKELLEKVGLWEERNKKVSEYSGGMRKRLSLALAMLPDPEVLILDEVTAGMDVRMRRETWEILFEERKRGKAILVATHLMEEAERISDRVGIMDEGRIVEEGKVEELKRRIGLKSSISLRGEFHPERIPQIPGVIKATENEIRILAEDPESEVPKIIERIYSLGMKVNEMRVKEPTLEDVFLALTGRELK